ncbi:hypothetical protein CEE37_02395 [candidate division LCP-89 bacterium B3_LCP]|uniref:Secretion system C-terminal sorting domain-containing protein n=1 Tax=candidate division LCP-89 bacterium B3_LCP TaxID=2012998 RepID=A0A532V5U3_UNCL8|nr:MAG: hypothetical protein CEE37_02395 [candidate division LCP-89 bacterium B3_LCP]
MYRGAGVLTLYTPFALVNNTISKNQCTDITPAASGAGVHAYAGGSSIDGSNNIVYGNIATVNPNCHGDVFFNYSCIEGGMTGTGNITDDPMFTDDYSLQWGSPCIDTGDPLSAYDPDGTIADMGAYPFDQTTGVENGNEAGNPSGFFMYSCYPNPFNPSTAISYDLPKAAHILLTVYDINGKQVAQLADGCQVAGSHELIFDAVNLSSGIYFARLQVGNLQQTQKLVLVK